MQSVLHISYDLSPSEVTHDNSTNLKYRTTPFAISEIYQVPIYNYEILTNEESRKVYQLKFSLAEIPFNYSPGSTVGILPSNDESLVEKLLKRLGIEIYCNKTYNLSISSDTTKKNACIPKHIPQSSTLRSVFLYHVDIKSAPKKVFLKRLLPFVSNKEEYEELEFLCSPKGSEKYNKLISSYQNRSLLPLLNQFPSCMPPVEILLEHLPPLFPRLYSIASSPLNDNTLSITFNVDTFGSNEKGVCAAWLEQSINKFEKSKHSLVPLYFRVQSDFKLPENNFIPIILVATGTGIAPFRGFLEHRHLKISLMKESFSEAWLFYGCRDSKENYLYKADLQTYLNSGALTKLIESFSRETTNKSYVQQNIEIYGEELSFLILEKSAVIYVCGDFVKVLPEVKNSFINILIKFKNFTKENAELYLQDLEKTGRYILDKWQ
ncbi:hypothetical protein WA026_011394 [Henosepilachna vigintioctopunctata]|uniref:Methionine synthase reductase n=1 Tax=Henosepilachna vigintioctopunctata TaxID=420089 RepID=A0AAW1TR20_9CUCU